MKLSDLFRFSTDNLRRRKGRTVLTVIGVVVGVCAIVVMISLGIAVNIATDTMLQSYGDLTKITVNNYGAKIGTPDLDDKMVEQFKALPNVAAATPMYSPYTFYGNVYAGKNYRYESWGNLVGMDVDAIPAMGYSLITGNFLSGQNLGKDKIPVLIGSQVVFSFSDTKKSYNNPNRQKYPQFGEDGMGSITNLPQYDENGVLLNPEEFFFDVMNTKMTYRMNYGYDETTGESKYKEYELVVVGIIKESDMGGQTDYSFVMNISDLKKMEQDYKTLSKSGGGGGGGGYAISGGYYGGGGEGTTQVGGYEQVFVKVDNVKNMPAVEKALTDIGYQIYSMSQLRQSLQGQVAQTQMMLGGLAAVSLFVAALNIANTMTMAIYERTKEIGVMKVLGCKLSNIRTVFLIESGAIGLIGGVVGVVISLLLSMLLNNLATWLAMLGIDSSIDIAAIFGLSGFSQMMPGMQMSVIPLWLIVLALVFATLVGLLSGIAPANRAVKISSLEAIRHE
ncbi:ABC transporter permease [Ruminococcaceae bacterium OttesenSCG-928-A16]|nr:ABC transporter permease [Ruminococcaceae bacterium OttesenSCG-928-A16]